MGAKQLLNILDQIHGTNAFRAVREPSNCGQFLSLYERVGYGPKERNALEAWRERTLKIWRFLDENMLPNTCAGGLDAEGRVVSSWGTLPISPSVVYGHSVCMDRTLWGVSSLYLQGLYSIEWANRIAGITHWAGSYPYSSNFTGRFQRPEFEIPGQIMVNVVKCLPLQAEVDDVAMDMGGPFQEADLDSLSEKHRNLFTLLRTTHPLMADVHRACARTLRFSNGQVEAVLLYFKASAELTAANVFSRTWIFPREDATDGLGVAKKVLGASSGCVVHLVATGGGSVKIEETGQLIPSFWAFCPKKSLGLLKVSLASAFEKTISKYTDSEIDNVLRRLAH